MKQRCEVDAYFSTSKHGFFLWMSNMCGGLIIFIERRFNLGSDLG